MIYLASPYSGTFEQRELRYFEAMRCVAFFINHSDLVYSPIVYCHEMAKRLSLPTDAHFWKEYNERFIKQSRALWVLCIPGWKQSVGVDMELRFADELQLQIEYIVPWEEEFQRAQKPPRAA